MLYVFGTKKRFKVHNEIDFTTKKVFFMGMHNGKSCIFATSFKKNINETKCLWNKPHKVVMHIIE